MPSRWMFLFVAGLAFAPLAQAQDQGQVRCQISDNGKSARGTLVLLRGEQKVANGTCGGAPLTVSPGTYVAVVSLDGALDAPTQRKPLKVDTGKTATVSGAFKTGTLRVEVRSDGRRAAGMATIWQGKEKVGTLGGGVAAHLSAGVYRLQVRYRDTTLEFDDVRIEPGKERSLAADF